MGSFIASWPLEFRLGERIAAHWMIGHPRREPSRYALIPRPAAAPVNITHSGP